MRTSKASKGLYIAILGPTGVGKSTIGNILTRFFYSHRYRTVPRPVLMKYYHGLAYVLWSSVYRLIVRKSTTYAPWVMMYKTGRIRLVQMLTKISMFIDILLSFPIKIMLLKLLKSRGFTLVSEEHAIESFCEYVYILTKLSLAKSILTRFCLRLLYAYACTFMPDVVLLLDADLSSIYARWRMRLRKDPNIEYVYFQQITLNKIADLITSISKSTEVIHLNTSNLSVRETFSYVLKYLKPML